MEGIMQDSSAFQFIAIDQIDESTTNPRQTFDQKKWRNLPKAFGRTASSNPLPFDPMQAASRSSRVPVASVPPNLPSCFPFPPVLSN
jgi:hypothetical protein